MRPTVEERDLAGHLPRSGPPDLHDTTGTHQLPEIALAYWERAAETCTRPIRGPSSDLRFPDARFGKGPGMRTQITLKVVGSAVVADHGKSRADPISDPHLRVALRASAASA